ncbi:hypothetical protein ABZX51_012110 [Aspergillus tubingensis]|uniref:peptidase M12A, astacin n=1 Tax=Aspergillus tubingensis TaxID=5068 RepID=UPI001578EFD1|nr:peptidase M12A, astacin [Aspergillus tubingensis]GFN21034.1 peptidase M12A, astacin [Aspergillus tubingensis]GLA96437.1 hypothetical protein AtubIFM57143_003903 [Aspergillus tubingensis]
MESTRICVERIPSSKKLKLPPGNLVSPSLGSGPAELAMPKNAYWRPGTKLHVRFLSGSEHVKNKVKYYAQTWEHHANIDFVFDDSPMAQIRVSFVEGGGSWSYLGVQNLDIPSDQATMNFGWFDDNTRDDEFSRTTIHEFGHALGCIHEHMSPSASIPWDKKKVYRYFMGPPNSWSKEQVDQNLFRQYAPSEAYYTKFDPLSIMLYRISNDLTLGDYETPNNTVLSATDKMFIHSLYPEQAHSQARFTTQEFRPPSKPNRLNAVNVNFEPEYKEAPSIAVGLTELNLSKDFNVRVKAYADRITKSGCVIHADSWADTILFSAGAAWFEVSSTDTEFQTGSFDTLELHPWNEAKPQNRKRVVFERSFAKPPKVVVWLQGFDMDKRKDWRIAVHASNISSEGLDIHIDTWGDSILYSASASWIAYPADKDGIFSGAVDSSIHQNSTSSGQSKGGRVDFPKGLFDRKHRVYTAIKSFNVSCKHDLRLNTQTENVTKDGFDWKIEAGGDSTLNGAGISYVVI